MILLAAPRAWAQLVNEEPRRMLGYSSFHSPGPQEVCERHRVEAKRLAVRVRTLEAALELVTAFYAACDTNGGRLGR